MSPGEGSKFGAPMFENLAYKADQPFLLVYCSVKFILFKSVCLSTKFFVLL